MESIARTKLKICGLCRPEDIAYVNEVQPDFAGFVFWEKSRRYVTKEQARSLRAGLHPRIAAVGVFLDAPVEEVTALLEEQIIDMAQLHGEESEEDIRYIQAVTGKPVIKALKVHSRREVEAWLDSAADYLLFDSGNGSGQTFDWSLLAGVERDYFLAGGLCAENLSEAVKELRPYAVDISSGVETDGKKDLCKIKNIRKILKELNS